MQTTPQGRSLSVGRLIHGTIVRCSKSSLTTRIISLYHGVSKYTCDLFRTDQQMQRVTRTSMCVYLQAGLASINPEVLGV